MAILHADAITIGSGVDLIEIGPVVSKDGFSGPVRYQVMRIYSGVDDQDPIMLTLMLEPGGKVRVVNHG